jgi:hypothetical protein
LILSVDFHKAAGEMFKDKNFMVLVAQLRGLKNPQIH